MVKVAYCISGESRSLEVWNTHLEHIVVPNKADKFLHTWQHNHTKASSFSFPQRGDWRPLVYSNSEAIATINPLSHIIESTTKLDPDIHKHIERPPKLSEVVPRDRCFFMWRGWFLVFKCMEFYGEYDVVIRSRSDILFSSALPFPLNELDENTIYIPVGNDGACSDEYNSVCDWLALGKKDVMKKYCSIYKCVGKYMRDNIPLHPEIMLAHHLATLEIKICRFPLNYSLHRNYWKV